MKNFSEEDELRQFVVERFWETVPPVWHQVRNHVRSIATERYEISVEQFHILRMIHKGITLVSDLADARSMSRPAISQMVDGLVEKGYITRRQDPKDRRYVHLALTEEGTKMLTCIFAENRSWMAAKLEHLSPEELNAILSAFELLKGSLN
jgi:DNA-binding MarR family transcriptional regulator